MDEARRRNMRAIRGKDTMPELIVRRMLHRSGFRYRLQAKGLPGKPDLAIKKYKLAIFVQGCFWHWHGCEFFRVPKTRMEWWTEKLSRNRERDKRDLAALLAQGWHVLWIWECYLKKHKNKGEDAILEAARSLIEMRNIQDETRFVELPSRQAG
jgi:DNA mismatch endonuclease (patch repair protein)